MSELFWVLIKFGVWTIFDTRFHISVWSLSTLMDEYLASLAKAKEYILIVVFRWLVNKTISCCCAASVVTTFAKFDTNYFKVWTFSPLLRLLFEQTFSFHIRSDSGANTLNQITQCDCNHMTLAETWPNKACSVSDRCHTAVTAFRPICVSNVAESIHAVRGEWAMCPAYSPLPLLFLWFDSWVYWVKNGVLLTALSISVMRSVLAHHGPLL